MQGVFCCLSSFSFFCDTQVLAPIAVSVTSAPPPPPFAVIEELQWSFKASVVATDRGIAFLSRAKQFAETP